jgi:bifunctional DNA-binding transcriptional regulator/antitoxin component of YhaV-PrlF toxin-antitoxin module
MTGTVNSKRLTVVPKALRERFQINSGASLDWHEEGASLRGTKLDCRREGSFLDGLRRLGRVPAAPRDKRPLPSFMPHLKSFSDD